MTQKIITSIIFLFTLFLGIFFVFNQKNQKVNVPQKEFIVVKSFHFGYPFEIIFPKGTSLIKAVQAFNVENELIKNLYIKKGSSWKLFDKNFKLYEDIVFKIS